MVIGAQARKDLLLLALAVIAFAASACAGGILEPVVVTRIVYQTAQPTPRSTPTVATPTPTPLPTATPLPTPTPTPWPAEGSTPEQQGMDSETLAGMFDYIQREGVNVHGLLIVRHGYTVVEAYAPPYQPEVEHNTYSCGKSVTSALVGIAIEEGYIDGVDEKVLDFFPDRTFANDDPRKAAMTLEHLLTMTSGLDWPESSVPYSSSRNILGQMLRSRDWVQFVLDRPMVAEPGTTFNYSTGVSHLLSAIIQEATGMSARSFARAHLFGPLGIPRVYWMSSPDGVTLGGGGIWMTPREMAKFGQLYLQGGVWDGRQVIPADWVAASVARQVGAHTTAPYYGYQWWVRSNGTYAAHGYKGQRIFVIPDLDMVVIFTGDTQGSAPSYLLSTYIVPAARSAEPLPENPQGVALLEARIGEMGR